MGVEIEAKMKLDDPASLCRRLRSAGAKPIGNYLEINKLFDHANGDLRRSDKALRLRINQDLSRGRTAFIITYKGPRKQSRLKSRQEIEFTVSDAAAAKALLNALSYEEVFSFQKRRRSWKLLGCKVEIDQLPYLGWFVEIEGPGARRVMRLRKKLGLATQPLINQSYVWLLRDYMNKRKRRSRKVEFRA
jgi:adenylate cyclase, class 2